MDRVGIGTDSTIGPAAGLPQLPLGRYRLLFREDSGRPLTGYQGSAWRGALGHALKQTVCVTRLRHCPDCLLYRSCLYPYIFETPPPLNAEKMRRYTAAPHPFVIEPPLAEEQADQGLYPLGLVLFGQANRHLPYLIHALRRAGAEGLGKQRILHTLIEVQQALGLGDTWPTIHVTGGPCSPLPESVPVPPDPPGRITVHLLTPLRIRRAGKLVGVSELRFADFFAGLLRRISMLTYFHTGTPLETDFRELMALAREIPLLDASLRWQDWTRYSSRQKTLMQMGGLVGSFRLSPGNALWPYLWLGQWTHAGKGASMGLGRYRITPTASLPDETI